jgi:hypothetical protein
MKLKKLATIAALLTFNASAFAGNTFHNDTIVTSNSFTSSFASADVSQGAGACTDVLVSVTALTGVIVPQIQGKDQVTGNYYNILIGNPITSTGEYVLRVCSGLQTVSGESVNAQLPFNWHINFIFQGGSSATLSVEDNYIM